MENATSDFTNDQQNPAQNGIHSIQIILDALSGLRFGSVEIVIQDSRWVQIRRLEKQRLAEPVFLQDIFSA